MSLNLLKQIVKSNYPKGGQEDMKLIEKAYVTAERELKGIKRGTMNYFDHPVEAALTIAKMKMGAVMVAATLLHSLNPRISYPLEKIEANFGSEVADILRHFINLGGIEERYKETDKYIESARRMVVAVASDFRVLLIKFADRLSNLQHLDTFTLAQQKNMVEVTEKIYVPLSSIFGIWRLRWQMEDICFKYRNPGEYRKIQRKIEKGLYRKRQEIVYHVRRSIFKKAKKSNIKCEIFDRFKHVASVYRKMQERKKKFNEIYDVFAVRVVTDTVDNCYLLLGIIHSFWRPVPRRVKDYIAAPKPNGYQSLHTTVFNEDGYPMEFQICTSKMYDEARYGLAAHFYYKNVYDKKRMPQWIEGILTARRKHEESYKLDEEFNFNVLTDTIFCYTPKGDIMELPKGSTPVDFAYLVHTELGHRAKSAIVNDMSVSLNTVLKNNDIVEIVKKTKRHPIKNWLKFIKTDKARRCIDRFYSYHQVK